MKLSLPTGLIVTAALAATPAAAAPKNTAVLQGLDKVTARVETFDAQLNRPVKFGSMEITLRHCDRTPPEEPPESAAFLEIEEKREGDEAKELFSGWMFASSPALSALQHPVYDVWVLECVNREDAAEDAATDGHQDEQDQ